MRGSATGSLAALALFGGAVLAGPSHGENAMSEWMPIGEWRRCAELARPGITFEIRNAEGMSLFTPCTDAVPKAPWDWKSPPSEFRAIAEAPAERSEPLPAPASQD